MGQTVKCPYCAEEIPAEAKKCKHCNEWIVTDTRPDAISWDEHADTRHARALCFALLVLLVAILVGVMVHWIAGVAIIILVYMPFKFWYRSKFGSWWQ